MLNKSLWLKGVKNNKIKELNENIYTDVLIIGGGITGISTAYHLRNSRLKVTVIDAARVALGASSNSTGKLTYLQEDLIYKIDSTYGRKYSSMYVKSQIDAIDIIKDIIIQNNIKCNYESNSSFLFTNNKSKMNIIDNTISILKFNNIKYKIVDKLPIKFPSLYGIKVDNTAVINPYKYVTALREIIEGCNCQIFENTKATEFQKTTNGYLVIANGKKIFTQKLVIACGYPFFFKPYLIPFKTYLEKSYIMAGVIDKNKKFNAINVDKETHSIRYYSDNSDYLVYCSESRKLSSNMNNLDNYSNIFWKMRTKLTQDIKYFWFNYDLMTFDYLPIIGYLERDNKNLLIGTGYNTWGITNGSLAGKILSDLIIGKDNSYAMLFNPCRDFSLMRLFNSVCGNVSNVSSFIKSKFSNKKNNGNNVRVFTNNGIKYGCYIDKDKNEHVVLNICPHMKCSLSFNYVDNTWDCPCHGSRFDINGNVVKGPSTYSIKVDKTKS